MEHNEQYELLTRWTH